MVGAIALHAAVDALGALGWDAIVRHERALADRLLGGLASIDGVRLLGPVGAGTPASETLPVAPFTVDGMHHAPGGRPAECRVRDRRAPRLLLRPPLRRPPARPGRDAVDAYRREVLRGDHRGVPGAVRASAGLGTSAADVDALLAAVAALADGVPAPVPYEQDTATGDFFPVTDEPGWRDASRELGAACSRG